MIILFREFNLLYSYMTRWLLLTDNMLQNPYDTLTNPLLRHVTKPHIFIFGGQKSLKKGQNDVFEGKLPCFWDFGAKILYMGV